MASKTVYACTFIEKLATVDNYEHGCETRSVCTLHESCDITAATLPLLLKHIGEHYGLDIDDVFLPGDGDDEMRTIGYNRMENADGFPPTPAEEDGFKRGKIKLWLCDYTFAVERRRVEYLTEKDFEKAGIKAH